MAPTPTTHKGHKHHDHHGADLERAARDALERAGEQWTEMRAGIFASLAAFDRPVSAYDIAEDVSRRRGKRVAANSVYRILDLFVARNVATRVESRNAYLVNTHPECVHDCIFLVCDVCGATQHIDDDSLSRAVRARAAATGFAPDRPVLEVRGRCTACQDKAAAAEGGPRS